MSGSIVHVVGARPNFPKLAPVFRALEHDGIAQMIVHTGQHYDDAMSKAFFEQLDIPRPDLNLEVGSGSHARQTAAIMEGLEDVFLEVRPRAVVVYGDVNSTVAAALVASKLGIHIAHVEAGLRSFDRTMPEEINRIVTDRLSDTLFATSSDAVEHLLTEGVGAEQIHLVGNPMIDTLLRHLDQFDVEQARKSHGLDSAYGVVTMHRPSNVDDPAAARRAVEVIHGVADQVHVIFPVHPRGRAALEGAGLLEHPGVQAVAPLPYADFIGLVRGAEIVLTDSGGIQEETTVLGVPCVTLRDNTERPVTISHGTNQLATVENAVSIVERILAKGRPSTWPVPELWEGEAGPRIARVLSAL